MHVLLVVINLGVFAKGRTAMRQKVGFVQVFYDELTISEQLLTVGHSSNARVQRTCIIQLKKGRSFNEKVRLIFCQDKLVVSVTKDYNSLLPSRENETSSSLFEGHKCLACMNGMSGSFLLGGRPSNEKYFKT